MKVRILPFFREVAHFFSIFPCSSARERAKEDTIQKLLSSLSLQLPAVENVEEHNRDRAIEQALSDAYDAGKYSK